MARKKKQAPMNYQTIEQKRIVDRIREEHPNLLEDSPETIALREALKKTAREARVKYPETFMRDVDGKPRKRDKPARGQALPPF